MSAPVCDYKMRMREREMFLFAIKAMGQVWEYFHFSRMDIKKEESYGKDVGRAFSKNVG